MDTHFHVPPTAQSFSYKLAALKQANVQDKKYN
jgi:hypothetical protein